MKIFTIMLLMFCSSSYAECWKVGGFKGYSAKEGENYKIGTDGLTGQEFSIEISDNNSAVIPSNEMQCKQISNYSMVCLFSEKGRGTVETWSIDPKKNVAYYTKSNSGFGMFDGPVMFVGKVTGSCK